MNYCVVCGNEVKRNERGYLIDDGASLYNDCFNCKTDYDISMFSGHMIDVGHSYVFTSPSVIFCPDCGEKLSEDFSCKCGVICKVTFVEKDIKLNRNSYYIVRYRANVIKEEDEDDIVGCI